MQKSVVLAELFLAEKHEEYGNLPENRWLKN